METVEHPQPNNPGWFKLNPKIEVAFRPADAKASQVKSEGQDGGPNKEVLQAHLASVIPPEKWATVCTGVVWLVRWVSKGLQPIRPVVALTSDIQVSPGKAVELKAVG